MVSSINQGALGASLFIKMAAMVNFLLFQVTSASIDTTPTDNFLPYAASDIFGTNLSYSASYTAPSNDEPFSNYKAVGKTYSYDASQCIFYSVFGLLPDSQQST